MGFKTAKISFHPIQHELSGQHKKVLLMDEIRRLPVEVGSLSHDLQGNLAPSQVVGLGISEPSTVPFL